MTVAELIADLQEFYDGDEEVFVFDPLSGAITPALKLMVGGTGPVIACERRE